MSHFKPSYPSVVTLKKGVIFGALLVGVALFVGILFYNFNHEAVIHEKHQQMSQTTERSHTVSQADIEWFTRSGTVATQPKTANPALDPPVNMSKTSNLRSENAILAHSQKPVASAPLSEKEIAPTLIDEKAQQQHEELINAMRAPISSNQIQANSASSSKGHSNHSPVSPTAGYLNANDTTQDSSQAQKKAFLQANHHREEAQLNESLESPRSLFELQAGSVIPGVLISGINSDLPGALVGQVRNTVYDSISGNHVLIPQGAKLWGIYDSQIVYGQERVLVVWKRIIFPNGQSISLEGMQGVDLSGYAGFHDQVNNHYGKLLSSVLLMSVLSAGAQLSQPQQSNESFAAPSVGQMLAQSLGTNIADVGTALVSRDLSIQPTLEIRPGYTFNVMVAKDIVFPGPYRENA